MTATEREEVTHALKLLELGSTGEAKWVLVRLLVAEQQASKARASKAALTKAIGQIKRGQAKQLREQAALLDRRKGSDNG